MIIYKCTNIVNSKVYIGKTVKKLEQRKMGHYYDVRNGRVNNYFHSSIKKYGFDKFVWEAIETCSSDEELCEREIYWISFYQSMERTKGMNMTLGGDGLAGTKRSEEFKRNLGERNKIIFTGRKLSEEHKKKIGGRKKIWTDASRNKLRDKRVGDKNPFFGKTHTKEILANLHKSGIENNNSRYVYNLYHKEKGDFELVTNLRSFSESHGIDFKGLKAAMAASQSTYKDWNICRLPKEVLSRTAAQT